MPRCTECGSSKTERSSNDIYYMCGQSHYCEDCDEYFTPEEYEDDRDSYLGSPTSMNRRAWESEEEYRDRTED